MIPRRSDGRAEAVAGGWRAVGAAYSDIGSFRHENQDAWALLPVPGGLVLAVADGMGGALRGGDAAEAAIRGLLDHFSGNHGHPEALLTAAVGTASAGVRTFATTLASVTGTTLVAAVLVPGAVHVANIGDSRAYLVREGAAQPLSRDHSWVSEEVAAGRMTAEQARHDPRRNAVTRALTGDPVHPDLETESLEAGDVVVLCSDGIWEPLDDSAIAARLSEGGDIGQAVADLCRAAVDAGSRDNVTAVAARVQPA